MILWFQGSLFERTFLICMVVYFDVLHELFVVDQRPELDDKSCTTCRCVWREYVCDGTAWGPAVAYGPRGGENVQAIVLLCRATTAST